MSDSDTVETKKRGRPAARDVPEKKGRASSPKSDEKSTAVTEKKRGRGRPPKGAKKVAAKTVPKKTDNKSGGRGRPKKTTKKAKSDTTDEDGTSENDENESDS